MTKKSFFKYFLSLSLVFPSFHLFACLHAYQFKVFPVGTVGEEIITADFILERIDTYSGAKRYKFTNPSDKQEMSPMWVLKSFISVYDKNQKVIHNTALDTSYIIDSEYGDSLNVMYMRAYAEIKSRHKSIEIFKINYFTFCEYQNQCAKVEIGYDTATLSNYFISDDKKYTVTAFSDTVYYAVPEQNPYPAEFSYFTVNSVREYKNKKRTLLIAHICMGDALGVVYTTDKKLVGTKDENENEYVLSKEHEPDFKFKDITSATYDEPILHHGFGVDLFIVK